jgi:alkylated DNA nucleotide flippase Atl1
VRAEHQARRFKLPRSVASLEKQEGSARTCRLLGGVSEHGELGQMSLAERYRANPPFFTIAKGGFIHVFPGGDLPRGGLAKSLCDIRPPIFNDDRKEMFEIRPSLFHSVPEVAPGHWERLKAIQQTVTCATCKTSLAELIKGLWTAFDLMDYTNGYGFDERDVRSVIAVIPPGRWAGQGDVAAACGGRPGSGFAVRRLLNMDHAFGARYGHRVLYDDGSEDVANADALSAEGVRITSGIADPASRLSLEELSALRHGH